MRKITISLITVLIIIMVGIVSTYAYFEISEEHGITITTGEFEVEMKVYFNNQIVTINSPFYDIEKGVIIVNTFDPSATNYITKLDVYISLKPVVAARYRFKINQEWELTKYYLNQVEGNEIPPVVQSVYFKQLGEPYYPFSQLKFESNYQYKTDKDGYIYAKNIVQSSYLTTNIHVIDGGDPYQVNSNLALNEECYLYFDINFEIVQANRVEEIWGLDPSYFN